VPKHTHIADFIFARNPDPIVALEFDVEVSRTSK
jgi:hypothetical protein